jgi:DNA-binding CsgD family transcriptional regulator
MPANLVFALDAISNPVTIQDYLGIYTHCNQAYLNLIGKASIVEVVGCTPSQILPLAEAKIHNLANQQIQLSQSKLASYELTCLNMSSGALNTAKVSKSAIVTTDGQVAGFIAIYNVIKPQSPAPTKSLFRLTNQEDRILIALNSGLSVKSIARSLNISTHTVSGHLKAIYLKLNVRSRAEAQCKVLLLETPQVDANLEPRLNKALAQLTPSNMRLSEN